MKISNILDEFLLKYRKTEGNTVKDKLQRIIDDYKTETKDWKYYFIKYKIITKNPYLKLNIFTWKDTNGFNINSLGNSGKLPLHSHHLNPYIFVLKNNFKDNNDIKLNWGRFTDLISSLDILSYVNIRLSDLGWEINEIENYIVNEDLIKKYKLIRKGSSFILGETDQKDKIEVAIDFIKEIL